MRKYGYLLFDLASVLAMLLLALYLRNGLTLIEEGTPDDLYLLLLVTAAVGSVILPIMKTHTRMWRYTSASDLWAIVIAASLIVLLINGGLFLFNRLEVVPRSVPPMHLALMVMLMGGIRLSVRALIGPKYTGDEPPSLQHVLIVGTGQVAELYIAFAKQIVAGQISIEGLVDDDPALEGRSFHQYPIHGTPDGLPELLERFLVHGITITKFILTRPIEHYDRSTQKALLEMEATGQATLIRFDRQIGHYQQENVAETIPADAAWQPASWQADPAIMPSGIYPAIKRSVDLLIAAALMTLCAPLLLLTACLVYLDVGLPLLFWQKRPGLYAMPFRLFKFRTMRPARRRRDEDRLAHKSGDRSRTSWLGRSIRQLRLDELPQLYHILTGTMSFIGPRPLLPDDQPKGGEQRLCVRPGVTGWAQINGGDALSPEDKLVLDLWYIRHMSLWLDLSILLRTLIVVFQPDERSDHSAKAIERAREELHAIHPNLNLRAAS